MSRKVVFEGVTHDFPDDATDDEIRAALNQHSLSVSPPPAAPQSNLSKFGGGVYDSTIGPLMHPIDTITAPFKRTASNIQDVIGNLRAGEFKKAAVAALKTHTEMSPDTALTNDIAQTALTDPARAAGLATGQGGMLALGAKLPEMVPEGAKIASAVKGAVSEIKDTPVPSTYRFAGLSGLSAMASHLLGMGYEPGAIAPMLYKYAKAGINGAKGGIQDFNLSKLPDTDWISSGPVDMTTFKHPPPSPDSAFPYNKVSPQVQMLLNQMQERLQQGKE